VLTPSEYRTGPVGVRRSGAVAGIAWRTIWDYGRVSSTERSAVRLVAVDDLGDSQVAVVEDTPRGAMAVGMSAGKPFAVSNRCRHLFASLGEGRVTGEGCLECPWHGALYDVATGKMLRGPQGVFKPVAGAIRATTGARALKTFAVEVRDGAIWLSG
jgi:nitrite reductase/ring-hydroxylating ferredoxin subunit